MTHADDLRAWAKGTYKFEAAVELLLRAFGGSLAAPGNPWIRTSTTDEGPDEVRAWINFECLHQDAGAIPPAERQVLKLAASLAEDVPVALGDVVSRMDRDNLDLVLAAIAHAGGSHEHSGMTYHPNGEPKAFTHQTTLHPWPETAPTDA